MRRIFSYMRPYRRAALLSVLCVLAESVCELVIPLLMADIIDIGVAHGDQGYIMRQGGKMVLCALCALVLGIGSARFAAVCGQGLGAELRRAEYQKLQSFAFSNIDRFQVPSLVTRLTSDVTTIQNAVSSGLRPACRSPIMLLLATGMAFAVNARLASVFLIALPTLAVLLYAIIRRVGPLYGRMQRALDQVNRIVQENLTAVRVVKAYVRGDYEQEKFDAVNDRLQTASERAFRLAAMNMPALQCVMYATILAILWLGGELMTVGRIKTGELTGILSYVLQILNSLMLLSNVFLSITRSMASAGRILEVMDETPAMADAGDPSLRVERGEIVFDHVSFQYKKGAVERVLTDISCTIRAGQTVGVIGRTGAAKSTLVQLIPRLYDATEGRVLIDGRPVQDYTLSHLRDAVAVVLQKNTLFSGTLRDNLRWGKADATDEEMAEACRIACADEFIDRLADGYDTEMGQGGVNVSGGQKQRLCIARALLKHPRVLILDDSTSAVDTATEACIRQRLSDALPGMTRIIIAQRISSVRHADQILILEDGRLCGQGTHEELLAGNPIYQAIYASQKEGAEL
ncbi:MAG: ABC transporter ATP-binding protein/permease [Clostridiales bacterium]|nr:ABC transporter ATP-binding protein/permease [Clostridiales bacterium]